MEPNVDWADSGELSSKAAKQKQAAKTSASTMRFRDVFIGKSPPPKRTALGPPGLRGRAGYIVCIETRTHARNGPAMANLVADTRTHPCDCWSHPVQKALSIQPIGFFDTTQ